MTRFVLRLAPCAAGQLVSLLAFLALASGGLDLLPAAATAAALGGVAALLLPLLAGLAAGRPPARLPALPPAVLLLGPLVFALAALFIVRGPDWGWDHAGELAASVALLAQAVLLWAVEPRRGPRRPDARLRWAPPLPRPPAAARGVWAAGLLTLAGSLLLFGLMVSSLVTWHGLGLDGAWARIIPWAQGEGRVFGRDILYTYGPLGWLFNGAPDGGHLLAVLSYNAVFVLLFGSGLALLAGGWRLSLPLAWLLLLIDLPQRYNSSFVLAFLLLYFLVGRGEGRWRLAWTVTATLLLGVVALGKFSHALPALLAVLALDLDRWLARRALPLFLPLLLAAVALAQVAAGQPLDALPELFAGAALIVEGYAQAMGLEGRNPTVPALLLCHAGLLLATAVAAWRGALAQPALSRRWLLVPLLVAALCFLSWKAAMVRGHLDAWTAIPALAVPLLVGPWWQVSPRAATLVAMLLAATALGHHYSQLQVTQRALYDYLARSTDGLSYVVSGELVASFDAQVAALDEKLRTESPWPIVEGSVDVVGDRQLPALAWGLDYRPRPVFQGVAVMNAGLAAINLGYYRSAAAPQHVFADWQSIDGRWPGHEEGELRLELLARYELVGEVGGYLQLRRRPQALSLVLEPLEPLTLRFGRVLELPDEPGLLFARFEFERPLLGRLAEALWRAPILRLRVRLADGGEAGGRLLRESAAAGFLLSPRIAGLSAAAALWTAPETLAPLRVRSLQLLLPDQARWVHGEAVTLRLYRVTLEDAD